MSKPSLTTSEAAAQLTRTGSSWSWDLGDPTPPLTFGFLTAAPTSPPYYSTSWNEASMFVPFTEPEKAMARLAIALWSDVANIDFTEVTGFQADVDFAGFAWGRPGGVGGLATSDAGADPYHGYVWINPGTQTDWTPLSDVFHTLLHEFGHQGCRGGRLAGRTGPIGKVLSARRGLASDWGRTPDAFVSFHVMKSISAGWGGAQ